MGGQTQGHCIWPLAVGPLAAPLASAWSGKSAPNWSSLEDGLPFRWEPLHVRPDELFEMSFTFDEEVAAHPGKLVGTVLRHIEGKLFHMLFADEFNGDGAHNSSSSRPLAVLNLS